MELYEMTAHELGLMLRSKEVSASEIAEAVVKRIETVDDDVKAYMTVTADTARESAARVDELIADGRAGELSPLAGIPTALKDVLCTKGIRTTCSSKILTNFIPPYSATVVERLAESGFSLIGKTNMDEFAMGSSCENSRYFATHNPWDLSCVPGGSSGGSAAAVAADACIVALGSDTGGSIRQPAAFCGVVGLKPTYGRVSRFGLIAFASSLDQIGPLTKDVRDAALVMNAIAGHDPMDSTSVPVDVPDYGSCLTGDIKGLRIGMPKEYFIEGIDRAVRESVMDAIRKMESLGAVVEEISLPHTDYALATYYLIAPAECSSNLARYDGVRYGFRHPDSPDSITMFKNTRSEGFGQEVKRRIMLGTYALSSGFYDAYYLKAQKVRRLIANDFEEAFRRVDVIACPTTPSVAFPIGDRVDDPMQLYICDICTIPVNLAGICGISIPCGLHSGKPIGLQLIGKAFDEATLLRAAHAAEGTIAFRANHRPPMASSGGSAQRSPEALPPSIGEEAASHG